MSHSAITIPTDSTCESVGSSTSFVILSATMVELMAIPVALPKISLEAVAAIDGSLTTMLDLILESDAEPEPSEAPLSPDHAPVFPFHVPTLPDNHLEADAESEPLEDELEEPFEDDAPEASEPLPAQVVSTPPSQINPTPTIVSSPPLQIVRALRALPHRHAILV
ncbi:hypothetical protein Tco_1391785 [Tanacetum coccineum]